MAFPFRDRYEAGRELAERLTPCKDSGNLLVLGLPRGGVPVAFEVARHLQAPLDVFLVRKLGLPGHEELAMGAIATGGVEVLNDEVIGPLQIPRHVIDSVVLIEQRELERRERLYRGGHAPPDVRNQTVILVDDGLATGATMTAAVKALRLQQASRIIVAVPVGAPTSCEVMDRIADEVVCLHTPHPFHGVGLWYQDFSPTSDREVQDLLSRADWAHAPAAGDGF